MTFMEQPLDEKRKRVRFRCHHTGMKENDLLVGAFADRYLAEMTDDEVEWFETMLMDNTDIDLNNWLMGRDPLPEHLNTEVMRKLIDFINRR